MIKSAASAASPEGFGSRNQVGCHRSLPDGLGRPVPAVRMRSRRPGAPQAVGEAALAADLITASKSVRGGCASSRLDHGSPKMDIKASKNMQKADFVLLDKISQTGNQPPVRNLGTLRSQSFLLGALARRVEAATMLLVV